MSKKYYNIPEAKFFKLRARASMLAGSYREGKGSGQGYEDDNDEEVHQGEDNEDLSKSCSLSFDF